MSAHEVSQIETALRGTDKQRPALLDTGDILSREITIAKQSAAIRICLQSLIEHHSV
ncbi:hypothetical protein D3C86_2207700 [compost metagenome]